VNPHHRSTPDGKGSVVPTEGRNPYSSRMVPGRTAMDHQSVTTRSSDRDGVEARERSDVPQIRVAVQHVDMRRLIIELLRSELDGCVINEGGEDAHWTRNLDRQTGTEIVIIDEISLGQAASKTVPGGVLIVIAPEADASYRDAALEAGARGWLPRERVAEDLSSEVRRVLSGRTQEQAQ